MKLHFVSSFSKKLWDEYAEGCIRSQVRNLPEDCSIIYYIDGEFPKDLPADPSVTYKMLDQVWAWRNFEKNFRFVQPPEGLSPGDAFRFKFMPFAKKVFSLFDAYDEMDFDYLIWIDADVYVQQKMPRVWFENLPKVSDGNYLGDVVCLLRGKEWGHGDTGFFMLKASDEVLSFVRELARVYSSGFIFDMKEWHDAFIFSALLKLGNNSVTIKNLNTKPNTLHPFEHSPLHPYLTHYKGPQKKAVKEGKLDEAMKPA